MNMFAFGTPGPTELIIILVVALIFFGKRLPEVARSLGRGMTEFKRGLRDDPPPETSQRIESTEVESAVPAQVAEPTRVDGGCDEEPEPADEERNPNAS